jgi:hypothetical protein
MKEYSLEQRLFIIKTCSITIPEKAWTKERETEILEKSAQAQIKRLQRKIARCKMWINYRDQEYNYFSRICTGSQRRKRLGVIDNFRRGALQSSLSLEKKSAKLKAELFQFEQTVGL